MLGSYQDALNQAVTAAIDAGDILRAELHRPGGPRAISPGHAMADEQAEAVIRRRLADAFPDFGLRGEELPGQDRPSRDSQHHVWLIDPNDGTSAYLRGHRGSAVSIALLRDGVPVLGVVFAFAAPDDAGDLFAWAQGCGPMTRNGRPVERAPWRDHPDHDSTALVSQDADKRSRDNAETVRPARFRAVASIAYRLALVAAGEGEVGISINAPGDWDYAGGHALLLGVGGVLLDHGGTPITYTRDGHSSTAECHGGSPGIALASSRVRLVCKHGDEPRDEPQYPLVRPTPGMLIGDPAILARAHGCLLGQVAGDSLGGLVEFQPGIRIRQQHPHGVRRLADGGTWGILAGQPTDDSEMALMLARTLVQMGTFDDEAVARAYAWWFDSSPFDIGSTVSRAVSSASAALAAGRPVARAARESADPTKASNGSLMRISPLGIFGAMLDAGSAEASALRTFDFAVADAQLTHPHPQCQAAAGIYAATIAYAIRSGAAPREVYAFAVDLATRKEVNVDVLAALREAGHHPPADYLKLQGWVLIAFANAFYRLLHAPTLEEGVVETVMQGGDTDTNAAIAGALLGAVYGRSAIPHQWLDRVITCRPIKGLPGVSPGRARPKPLWPIDALALAERLLVVGGKAPR